MKVQEIGAFEAKTKLSELLEKVQRGQTFRITKRGKCVAVLKGVEELQKLPSRGNSLGERLRALRKRSRRGPESLKELISFGRR